MKKLILFVAIILSISCGLSLAQDKWAQTGFQFLSVKTNARATAMAEAFSTIESTSEALFYNPAGLARMNTTYDVSISQMQWIADIDYFSITAAFRSWKSQNGVIGFSLQAVDYGDFYFTQVANNEQGFEDIEGWKGPSALMFGLAYARELSDKFAVGGQVKCANQNLGNSIVPVYSKNDTVVVEKYYGLNVLAFDFGTLYRTGYKSLKFGMSVRNFSQEVRYEKEDFQLPLTFHIGLSMDVLDFLPGVQGRHALLLSFDAAHPRSHPEYVSFGAEYCLMDRLALRTGYMSNHYETDFSFGIGVKKHGLQVDYSYVPFHVFENINRFTARFSF